MKNNIFTNNINSSGGGGGIHSYHSSPIIVNNIFANNTAGAALNGEGTNFFGGALYLEYGNPKIMNCIFSIH